MIVTLPQEISTSAGTLVSTNVADETLPNWSAGTYSQLDEVIWDNRIWMVVASSTADRPDIGVNKIPASWQVQGYVNSLRMFTGTRDSKSLVTGGGIDVEIKSEQDFYNILGLLGLVGNSIKVEVKDSTGSIVQTKEEELVDIGSADWAEFFFKPYDQVESVVFNDIRYEVGGSIRIQILGESGTPDTACGRVVVGNAQEVGITNHDTSVGLLSFSKFERNGFGDLTVQEGRTVNVVDFDVTVNTNYVDTALRILRAAGGKIAFYVGDVNKESTAILGLADEPRINYEPTLSSLSVEVQGQ